MVKKININEYILYCFGLAGITLYLLYGTTGDWNHDNYESDILEYIHWLCGILIFLPVELTYCKVLWYFLMRENFEINFLLSRREIYVK